MTRPSDAVLVEMLESARLPAAEVERRLALATKADYWRALIRPADRSPTLAREASAERREAVSEQLERDGIFHLRGVLSDAALDRLNAIVDAVVGDGWPPVFAFAYDEFWTCARLEPIAAVVRAALGPGAWQVPHVWTHVVRPIVGGAGWQPHVDGNGRRRVSVWIALTAAAVENGCMYAVGRPSLPDGFADRIRQKAPIALDEAMHMLGGARALPAAAGDALGWTFDVVHWGGTARPGAPPRRALSLEFIAADESPASDERPLVALDGPLPPLALRLDAIAAGILEYRKFEPSLIRFEELAQRLRGLT